MTQQARVRIAHSVAALSLVATLRCNVYDDSLLGHSAPAAGSAGIVGHLGGSTGAGGGTAPAGFAGGFEADGGSAHGGFGGFEEVAGAFETGGAETSGGVAGTLSTGGAFGGTGGAVGGSGGALGGTSGTAGHGGETGGSGGSVQMAGGCAKLTVPLDDTNDKAHFVISLASTADLSGATINMRFYVQAGQGGTIFNYVQDSGTYHFLGVPAAKRQPLSSGSGWSTVSWDVGAEPDSAGTGIVKTSIKSIGIEINAQPSSNWVNPTIVYVDSINVTSPTLTFTFDAASSVSNSNTNGALWLNTNSQDTTASGCTVTWQATCP